MADSLKEHPVSEEEIEALRLELEDDPELWSAVREKLVVCDEFANTARRFVIFAKQMPRGEPRGEQSKKKKKKKHRKTSMATDDALFYMREALRLRGIVNADDVWNPLRISEEQATSIRKVNPFAFGGHDKLGAPIMWAEAGRINGSEVAAVWDLCEVKDSAGHVRDDVHNGMVAWYVRQMEYVSQVAMADLKAQNAGPHWDRVVLVLDASGVGMSSWSTKVKRWMVACQDIGNVAYANMLKAIFVVNVPYLVKGVWSMIKPFLDPFVAAKVKLYSKSETTKELQAHIDKSNLIDFLGGDLRRQDVMSDFFPDLVAAKRQERLVRQESQRDSAPPKVVLAEVMSLPSQVLGGTGETADVDVVPPCLEGKQDCTDARTTRTADTTEAALDTTALSQEHDSADETGDELEFQMIPDVAIERDVKGGLWCTCAC
jgi:hypothetical protein